MAMMNIREAINQTLHQEMERDPTIIVLGEDVVGGAGTAGGQEAIVRQGARVPAQLVVGANAEQLAPEKEEPVFLVHRPAEGVLPQVAQGHQRADDDPALEAVPPVAAQLPDDPGPVILGGYDTAAWPDLLGRLGEVLDKVGRACPQLPGRRPRPGRVVALDPNGGQGVAGDRRVELG